MSLLLSQPPPTGRQRRVLLVDADRLRRVELRSILTSDGYLVDEVAEPEQAVDAARSDPPDLILLDVDLPDGLGLELCGELRMEEEIRTTPIVLLTAVDPDSQEHAAVRGLLAGADDYIATPARAAEVRARVWVQLRNRRDRELLRWMCMRHDGYRSAALSDALTGAANRRAADETLARLCSSREGFVALILDVDHFKSINDTHGHSQGDVVLSQLAATLQRVARADDMVARFGGEEFLVLAAGAPAAAASALGERYRAAVQSMKLPEGCPVGRVTVSVGAGGFPPGVEPAPGDVVERIDAALYAAKRGGRNRVVVAPLLEVVAA
ncbi:MAG: diguanylate cyclase [Polyangiaceae bacterium]|nr:diguanylate cyclase [Polyangiaceae bacterium]